MVGDPIEFELFKNALFGIADEMALTVFRTTYSGVLKDNMDYSTALFDGNGVLVAQGLTLPGHLGSMPTAIASVRETFGGAMHPGDVFILNDPFRGGMHLPDVFIFKPIFCTEDHASPIAWACAVCHHTDVGGRVPGSMPADSRSLAEEGVVISPRPLDERTLEQLVARMRQPEERRADVRAQLAANRTGALRLAGLARRLGPERLREGTDAVLDYAEQRTRACLAELGDGAVSAADVLEAPEGDLLLHLHAAVRSGRLVLDFAGSAPQHEGNLNCPLAVTRSACLFAVRVLTDPDIPPSAGAYRPIEVRAPEGTVLNASPGAAVAAGNVETSSRVADLVLGAFGRALGQGTMNNLTLGDAAFTYYETIGGGQGACADGDGPSGVHVAMSNTLNTPIEALEREFPLRVVEYALRRGSGGAGLHRGGDGVVREIEALTEITFSLIAERRRHRPRGAEGGAPGACGRDLIDGVAVPGKVTGTLRKGGRLRIETPGGGGFGRPHG